MFEFLKKLGLSNNDKDVKKIVRAKNNGVKYVANKTELVEIYNWMNIASLGEYSFSELLLELGFDKDKIMVFKLIPSNDDKISLSFQYKDELYNGDRIDLYKAPVYRGSLGLLDIYRIKVSNDDYERIYNVYKNSSKLEVEKREEYIKEDIDDKTYMRRIYDDGFRITIKKNMFYNEIRLVCEKDGIKEVDNEIELKEYLLNIDDSISVNEIYKKICEISLGNEIDYKKINLTLYKGEKIVGSISFKTVDSYAFYSPKYEYEILENDEDKKFSVGESFLIFINDGRTKDIVFSCNDYRIEIGLRPFVQNKDNDKIIELRDYMIGLELPVKIDNLCSLICNKFLMEIDKFTYLKIGCYYKNKLTDMIHIENGILLGLELNRDGKIVKIDENGIYSYGYESDKRNYLVKMNEDMVVGYETYMDMGIESDDMSNMICNHINQARDEKVKVRKLVDGVLKKDNN